jgi:hypothetical protein
LLAIKINGRSIITGKPTDGTTAPLDINRGWSSYGEEIVGGDYY